MKLLLTIILIPIALVGGTILGVFYALFSFVGLIAEVVASVFCDIWGC